MTETLTSIGIVPPGDFPIERYETIQALVPKLMPEGALRAKFGQAWNGVRFRFYGMAAAERSLHQSIETHGTAPALEIRSEQENDLFVFFASAVSVFDCYHFAMYALGSHLEPAAFSLLAQDKERDVTATRTRQAFQHAFPNDPIVGALLLHSKNQDVEEIATVRNVLTHRIAVGRHHRGGGLDGFSTLWLEKDFGEDLLSKPRHRVAAELSTLVVAALQFVEARGGG